MEIIAIISYLTNGILKYSYFLKALSDNTLILPNGRLLTLIILF